MCGQAPNTSAILFYLYISTHGILHVLISVNQAFLFRASLVYGDTIHTYQKAMLINTLAVKEHKGA